MNRRALFSVLAAAFPALAAPTLSQSPAKVAVLTPQGLTFASLGAGVSLSRDNSGAWVLAATAPQIAHVRVTPAADGTVAGQIIALYRGGITMTEGEDYERVSGAVHITKQMILADDTWSALVQR